jgi:hypothetical protein
LIRCEKSEFFACFSSMWNIGIWSETKMKSEAKTNKKRSENCQQFCFKAKWSKTEAKFFSLLCEKSVFSLVFASEAKRKWNEAKTKRKRSKNFKAKKDKVKRDNLYRNEEKYQGGSFSFSSLYLVKRKEAKKRLFFSLWSEKSKKMFISFHLKAKQKIGSKTKRNKKCLEAKQSENMVY